ncbi:hypothetical protein KDAU_33890 [Dictyobacter aurantiacus]|uniref:Uncharacterized protein n=1 Tax=Dictyobacter aurantiacus TaxID=1936993 RepID=A0A401ZGP6_9CHLR|nr:gas vesicle protein GvpJ [Dictyobacter aurantiacus]GCE06060.1 hypothetical protein KDAU_33890 [Dictyobacter aurantiacus]
MEIQQRQVDDQTIRNYQVTLLELLDRLIDKGVMVKGEILLTVADVDLVYLNLSLLLSAVKTIERAARGDGGGERKLLAREGPSPQELTSKPKQPQVQSHNSARSGQETQAAHARTTPREPDVGARSAFPFSETKPQRCSEAGINIDPEHVERGLVALVLTLVDLIRQLMEKQAIRRIENEQLTEAEIERVGNAFFLLNEKLAELKETFDLSDEDLNLNLGPLGDLL